VVTIVRRDSLKKLTWKTDDVVIGVQNIANQITHDLKINAKNYMTNRIFEVKSLKEAKKLIKQKAGIVELLWCGKEECGHKLEESIEARLLGFPLKLTNSIEGHCIICGKKTVNFVRVAQAY
jgi:prolyl-tRNA synthetase